MGLSWRRDVAGRLLLPLAFGAAGFVAAERLAGRFATSRDAGSSVSEQTVPGLSLADVPLQVAVHDLLEQLPPSRAVRVCRALANRRVTLRATAGESLGSVLNQLARQVGATLIIAPARHDGRRLPTIACPDPEDGGYLTIGATPPSDADSR